jgi:hypothetical protein
VPGPERLRVGRGLLPQALQFIGLELRSGNELRCGREATALLQH